MVWIPNPNEPAAMFEEPIVINCKTIIRRDFKQGLDYYFLDGATYLSRYGQANPSNLIGVDYPDFDELTLGMPLKETFPCCAISPLTNPTDEADDRSHIAQAARIRLFIGVTADGPEAVKLKSMRYVKVVDAVLRTARRDFFTGMSNPFGVVLKIEHLYDVERSDETIFFNAAIVDVTVNLCER